MANQRPQKTFIDFSFIFLASYVHLFLLRIFSRLKRRECKIERASSNWNRKVVFYSTRIVFVKMIGVVLKEPTKLKFITRWAFLSSFVNRIFCWKSIQKAIPLIFQASLLPTEIFLSQLTGNEPPASLHSIILHVLVKAKFKLLKQSLLPI